MKQDNEKSEKFNAEKMRAAIVQRRATFKREKKSKGATKSEFITHIAEDFLADRSAYNALGVVCALAGKLWDADAPWEAGESLFTTNDVPFGESVTIRDPTVPEGFRKIASEYATLGHYGEQTSIMEERAEKAKAKAAKHRENYERLLVRANGDLTRLVYDFRDIEPEAAPDLKTAAAGPGL